MSAISSLFNVLLHIDQHLNLWSALLGPWLYLIVFIIIFAETGLVVTPFLPGDSLLFALGAMTTLEQNPLNLSGLCVSLTVAAIFGDNANYFFGKHFGVRVFAQEKSRLFNKSYLLKAEKFYEKYGAKAIVIARFAPIIRTMVPFVAGIGLMKRKTFIVNNILGGILWVNLFILAGHFFGNLEIVKQNFHIVIFAVILLSLLPMAYEVLIYKLKKNQS